MLKEYQTKDITNEDVAEPKKKLVEFNFPEHGITVDAADLEEATEKLNKLINK
jgi:hypothetical protein